MTGSVRPRGLAALIAFILGFALVSLSPGGTLNGSYAVVPVGSSVDLTAAGPVDWVHWGLNTEYGYDRKASVPALIGSLTAIIGNNGSGPYQYSDNYNGYSWTDGAPNTFATNTTTGVWAIGRGSGFQLTVPADTVRRRLSIYVGAFGAQGQFDASLSDSSAPAYSDSSLDNGGNGPCSVYTLDYAADSDGQTLTVSFVVKREHDNKVGNVTWQAAALSYVFLNNPPTATLTSPAPNSSYATPVNVLLSAIAADSDGTIAKVEFFRGSSKLGEASGGNYSLVWSNAPPGDYLLRAVATDDGGSTYTSKPVEIFISTNRGSLIGSVVTVPGTVDLTADGNLDWAHWGLGDSSGFDHKSNVTQQISNCTKVGSNTVQQITGYPTYFDWSDGTPNANGGTYTGVSLGGLGNGFEFTIPAANYTKTLNLYVGLYGAQGNLQAFLSDFSALAYTDTSLSSLYGNAYGLYTLSFSTPSYGQTLHVRYTSQALYDVDFGNITLEAASLSGTVPPPPQPIVLLNPGWGNGVFRFSFATESNRIYTVEYTTSFNPASWRVLVNVAGDGTVVSVSDAWARGGRRFYRVTLYVEVPPQPPQPIQLLNPSWTNGGFRFSFLTETNRSYTVEYTESLRPPNWQVLTNVGGNGAIALVGDAGATGSKRRFYRVWTQ